MSEESQTTATNDDLLRMTAKIVSAYVGNNKVDSDNISDLISSVHGSLDSLQNPETKVEEPSQKPAVPIRRSVTPDHIICLEDGKKLKMLKRYLRTNYDMSPEEYRAKWGLRSDYPMVAPNYAAQRSSFAKKIGLGTKGRGKGKAKSRGK
jgi:predicted transcriptional regulator